MIKVIIDTNLWISFLSGKKLAALRLLLLRKDVTVYICQEQLDEFRSVAFRPKIMKYISIQDVNQTIDLMTSFCQMVSIQSQAESSIRDSKDLYLLSLAETISADYILTGDKDLLVLKHHDNTSIIPLSSFLEVS